MGLDLLAEVGLVLDDPGNDQASPTPARDLDREMHAFVRVETAKEDQVVAAALLERVERQVDPVVDGGEVVQPGSTVGITDRNVVSVAILFDRPA